MIWHTMVAATLALVGASHCFAAGVTVTAGAEPRLAIRFAQADPVPPASPAVDTPPADAAAQQEPLATESPADAVADAPAAAQRAQTDAAAGEDAAAAVDADNAGATEDTAALDPATEEAAAAEEAAATEDAAVDAHPAAATRAPAAASETTAPPSMPSTTLPLRPDAHEIVETNAPRLLTEQEPTEKKLWEEAHGGFTASRLAIQRRMRDFPRRLLVDGNTLPRQSRAFLKRVAEDTWHGLLALTDAETGLPFDHIQLKGSSLPPLAGVLADYVNVTSIGLQLACIAAAHSIDLITHDEAEAEAARILDTLAHLDRHDGQFYNYYDTTSLEATSTFLSFVDTAWLVAGLIVTRQAFPKLAQSADEIIDSIDLGYFYDRTTRQMSHGYYVNKGVLSVYTYGAFYTEARLGSLIAIGKGDAPVNHWYAMKRAFNPRCSGDDCPSTHELAYTARDRRTMRVRAFRWQGRQYVPSWGGSMFEALMPRLVLDEQRYARRSLGPNGEAHAMIQQEYAREVLGYPVWGMSPSMDPNSGRYGEFGVPMLGSHGYEAGVVTPHAAALALAVAPDDAADNLMQLARRYHIYGQYGFYDAVDPRNGAISYSYLQLDQAMLFLSVANHLSHGAVPRLFAADPYIKPALALLGEERFFE